MDETKTLIGSIENLQITPAKIIADPLRLKRKMVLKNCILYCLLFSLISLNNVHLFISKNFYSIISYSIQQFVVSKTLFYETTRGPCLGKETTFRNKFS